MSTKLRDKTLILLRERKANLKLVQVSAESGLPLSWLKKFHSAGEKFTPSADKLIVLYEYLSGEAVI